MLDTESMFQASPRPLPTQTESLEAIEKEAAQAIKALQKRGALDLADALGLSAYLEGAI